MKYYEKLKVFKNSTGTLTYDPVKGEAYSYSWWKFLERKGNTLIFNSYQYSSSTSRHQRDVWLKLETEDVVRLECPAGLQSERAFDSIEEHYTRKILDLIAAIEKKNSRKEKNVEREAEIERLTKVLVYARDLYRKEV